MWKLSFEHFSLLILIAVLSQAAELVGKAAAVYEAAQPIGVDVTWNNPFFSNTAACLF
jgi:hypothetical protein